jgi:hypothetical protein
MACCAEKFKRIDPATFGKAPELPEGNPWLRDAARPNR